MKKVGGLWVIFLSFVCISVNKFSFKNFSKFKQFQLGLQKKKISFSIFFWYVTFSLKSFFFLIYWNSLFRLAYFISVRKLMIRISIDYNNLIRLNVKRSFCTAEDYFPIKITSLNIISICRRSLTWMLICYK